MRDIKGFCKLLDINIPDNNYFEYYINILSKLDRWKNIYDLIKLYEEAEDRYDLYEYRLEKAKEIISYLGNTRAYLELVDDNLMPDLLTTKNFEYLTGVKYISVDMQKANWQSLKYYDPHFDPQLGNSYEEFLSKFDLPEIFTYSKQFRQFIFGNINPKRQCKVQRFLIQKIIDQYDHLKLKINYIKNDEVIYSFNEFDEVSEIVESIDKDKFKIKLFTVDRIQDFRVNTYLSTTGQITHKEMVGCNGNMFYLNLKKYILNEPIDIRDLYFKIDGSIAIWNIEGLKVSL